MKKLVVFYSFEGNTKYISENIAKALDADILELKPVKDIKNNGFMKYVWGGKQVVTGSKPELTNISVNFNDYDIIFMGTPVWAFSFSPAFNTFFSEYKITGKKIALFCCDGGNKGKTFTNMRTMLSGNDVLGEIEFQEPIKGNEEKAKKAVEWALKMAEID
ncbi:MAG: flavodoxin family protein [Solirubrobacterales bacterium]